MANLHLIALVLVISPCFALFDNTSLVITKYGGLRGFQYDMELGDGSKADIFLGIPYAKPPIGDLRFEKTVPVNPWFGIRDATKWALPCAPATLGSNNVDGNSEDCLYLNVFRPSGIFPSPRPPKGGYPVLVWIHGGSNAIGSALQFGYKNLSRNFVPQGVIVVSVQYRLGPFGYATTGDSTLPGNNGFWDMTQAAKFLGKVIGQFGGNPKKINLWGLSSSAIAIGSLALSPNSRDHFHGTVLQSGSAFSRGINNEGIQWTYELARQLNCSTSTSAEVKACLKSAPFGSIFSALNVTGLTRLNPQNINVPKYQPRIDGDFFPHNISTLFETAPPKPTYFGVGSSEGSLYSVFGNRFSPFTPLIIRQDAWPTYGEANFSAFVHASLVNDAFYGPQAQQAAQDVIDYYSSDKPENATYVYWIRKYTQLISDALFNIPLVVEAGLKANKNWPAYMYVNEHYSQYLYDQISPDVPVRGSFHTNEYAYQYGVFGVGIVFPFDAQEKAFQRALLETIGNFVKTGNPSTPYLNWQKITPSNPYHYAVLNSTSSFNNGPLFSERLQFWNSINNGTYPFNLQFRVNYQNTSTYACDITTNYVC